MKTSLKAILATLLMVVVFTLAACGGVKVTFYIGDATVVYGELEQEYKEDKPVDAPVLKKDGYKFIGWDKDFSAPTEDIIVAPIWAKLYTVRFEVEDAVAEVPELLTQKIVDGEGAVAPKVTRDGYVFDGWDKEFSAVSASITVTAKWKKIHTVTFKAENATANDTSLLNQKIVDGEDAVAPEVTRDGYVFDGWDTDFSAISGDITVTAKWKKIHTVTFELDGGSTEDESLLIQKVVDGADAKDFTPVKDKYIFLKWSEEITSVSGDMTVKAVWERKSYTSTEIHDIVSLATVEITTFRPNGQAHGLGSGFFISEDGVIITNYHVIDNASKFIVQTYDEKSYTVSKVIAYDKNKDIAILKIDAYTSFDYLEIASESPKAGEDVWALGSSLGLTDTFSSGIVSNANRVMDGVTYIQTTAPISSGNSGGPLVNKYCEVVGINTLSFVNGQNLNLAVEISQYKTLKTANYTPSQFFSKEATIKYWINENKVNETSASYTTGQVVANGSTVYGHHDGGEYYDIYMTSTSRTDNILLMLISAESEDVLAEISSYIRPLVANGSIADGNWLNNDTFVSIGLMEENGVTYYACAIVLPDDTYWQYSHVGIAMATDTPSDYELFLYLLNQETLEAIG